jgi:hypothetical protein
VLELTWESGQRTEIRFQIEDVEFTVSNRLGEPATFTSKLSLTSHMFPLGEEFPDGWPLEYYGYTRSGDD